MENLKAQITESMKQAMRARDKERLGCIRLILAAFKQVEVDERCEVDDVRALAILEKMRKQRQESIRQYEQADRPELADKERFEIEVIETFLPAPLSESEVDALIEKAVSDTGAAGIRDMGKVMAQLKPQLQGRADMGLVSAKIKATLNA